VINKDEVEVLMSAEGEARGAAFRTDALFVEARAGADGLRRVEREATRLGHPIDYGAFDETGWYPVGLRILSLLVIRDVLELDDREVEAMADAAPRRSFIFKLMVRFFVSPRAFVMQFPQVWERHYTMGRMDVPLFDAREQRLIIRLWDARLHPVQCPYLQGYLRQALSFVFPGRPLTIREQKCVFRGDDCHEYEARWGEPGDAST